MSIGIDKFTTYIDEKRPKSEGGQTGVNDPSTNMNGPESMANKLSTSTNAPGAGNVAAIGKTQQDIQNLMFQRATEQQGQKVAQESMAGQVNDPGAILANKNQVAQVDPGQVTNNSAGVGFQDQLMQQLAAQSTGGGPQLGNLQFQQGLQQNLAAQQAAMAGQRGIQSNLAMRQIGNQAAAAQQQTAQQAAQLASQQQLSAQQQLGTVAGTAAGQGLQQGISQAGLTQQASTQNATAQNALTNQLTGQGFQGALAQAQMNQNASQFNASLNEKQQQMNNEVTLKYMQLGMTAEQAAQQAMTDIMKAQVDIKKTNASGIGGMLGGAGTAIAGIAAML